MTTTPTVITCRHCGAAKRVRPSFAGQKFCSKACALAAGVQLTPAGRLLGAEQSKVVRRQQAMRKLAGMTPVEIYRQAYTAGWHAGVRYVRRCQEVAAA